MIIEAAILGAAAVILGAMRTAVAIHRAELDADRTPIERTFVEQRRVFERARERALAMVEKTRGDAPQTWSREVGRLDQELADLAARERAELASLERHEARRPKED